MRVLAFHQRGLGLSGGPGVIIGLSLLLVLVLVPRGSLLVVWFSSPQKLTIQILNQSRCTHSL